LNQLRFQRINANCVEVAALIRCGCFYASSRKLLMIFWSNVSTLNYVWN